MTCDVSPVAMFNSILYCIQCLSINYIMPMLYNRPMAMKRVANLFAQQSVSLDGGLLCLPVLWIKIVVDRTYQFVVFVRTILTLNTFHHSMTALQSLKYYCLFGDDGTNINVGNDQLKCVSVGQVFPSELSGPRDPVLDLPVESEIFTSIAGTS